MPTILLVNGYRIYFVSFDGSEPIHVHVRKDKDSAKIWLEPIRVAWSQFKEHESKQILNILHENKDLIREKWNEHFSD